MRQHRSFRPSFENLESRLNMSVVLGFDGPGRLASVSEDASGQDGPVSMVVQTDGRISISDGANSLGTYARSAKPGDFAGGGQARPREPTAARQPDAEDQPERPSGLAERFACPNSVPDSRRDGGCGGRRHDRRRCSGGRRGRQSVLCVRRIRQGGPARGNGHRFAAG